MSERLQGTFTIRWLTAPKYLTSAYQARELSAFKGYALLQETAHNI